MAYSLEKLACESINWVPTIAQSAFIFATFYFISMLADKMLTKGVSKNKYLIHSKVIVFSIKFIKRAIIFLGFVMALDNLNIDISTLLAGIGITGFALGFALKEVLSNAVSSVIIMLYTPFEIGDHIVICGAEGQVTKIDVHYTTLTHDTEIHLIPNIKLVSERITILRKN